MLRNLLFGNIFVAKNRRLRTSTDVVPATFKRLFLNQQECCQIDFLATFLLPKPATLLPKVDFGNILAGSKASVVVNINVDKKSICQHSCWFEKVVLKSFKSRRNDIGAVPGHTPCVQVLRSFESRPTPRPLPSPPPISETLYANRSRRAAGVHGAAGARLPGAGLRSCWSPRGAAGRV